MLQNQQDIGYLIKQLDDRLRAVSDAAFRQHGTTLSQVQVLEFLGAQGGAATQKQIETFLGVSHPTVVGLVERLRNGGFVTHRIDEANRHNKIVAMTDKARGQLEWLSANRAEIEARLVRGFSEEDVAAARRLLTALYTNVQ